MYLFDNETTVIFAIFMSFWAALFLEFWKRYSAEIAHRWDVDQYQPEGEHPRELQDMMPAKFPDFLTPSTPLSAFGTEFCSIRFTQPPLLRPFFHDPPSLLMRTSYLDAPQGQSTLLGCTAWRRRLSTLSLGVGSQEFPSGVGKFQVRIRDKYSFDL